MMRPSTASCEIGMPVERIPASVLIRDRSRETAIARRTASLASSEISACPCPHDSKLLK